MKIVELQKVKRNNELRLESDFWIKEKVQFKSVKGIDVESFCQYGTSKELNEDGKGYPVLRLNEFDSFFIHEPAKYCEIIDAATYNSLKLKKNDVLICRTNGNPKYVGKAALVPRDYDYAFASYLYRIRPKLNIINSATLVAYLNSKYGRTEIERLSLVGNQANFSPAKFRQIEIPILDKNLQQIISESISLAYQNLQEAKDNYLRAENILIHELGLTSWKPSHEQIAIRYLQETRVADRIDAEFYQPQYLEIVNLLRDYGSKSVNDSCILRDKNFTPNKNNEYKYIELGDIGSFGEILHYTIGSGKSLPSRARRIIHTGDVIVSSIEGSLQKCAYITDDYNGCLCSTGFYVIYSDIINPETLLVLFKSTPIQKILKKNCAGAILSSFKKDSLLNLEIPIIRSDVQDVIATLIKKSFRLRKESEIIIDASKHSIELAIENDVQSAIRYMEDVLSAITNPIENKIKANIDSINKTENKEGGDTSIKIPINYDEPLMAAETFECYKWGGFNQRICNFFGEDKTILVGCYKDKKHLDWILSQHLYTIRLGKTKGSMGANRTLFESTSLLVLYELGKPNKLTAYKIIGHKEMSKDELLKLDYPNKKPRKNYMTFSITPMEMDLNFLIEHHLIEKLVELNAENAKGTPVFIEP